MKKIFAVLFATLFLFTAGMAMASPPVNPGPGYYEFVNPGNPNDGTIKYFPNGQPENNSQWKFVGTTPPPPNPCHGSNCINKAYAGAIANPGLIDFSNNPWGNATGGFSVIVEGNIQVDANGQGTKSALADAYATGTAFGVGGAAGIQCEHFGVGASGAFSAVILAGGGDALGIDKFGGTKDLASVEINYSGFVEQSNGINVDNGAGTFAGGYNTTSATFNGGSYAEDLKFGGWSGKLFDVLTPAVAFNVDGAGAYAGGASFGSYVDVPNFAAATSLTVGFSGYVADQGYVQGNGTAYHQAVANSSTGVGYGVSAGTASFCYEGTGTFGAGYAKTGGYSVVQNGPNSQTVSASSHSSAGSMVGGGYVQPTLK
jgi:hypothetical protein